VNEIRDTLSSYPEEDLSQKLVHFIFYGRQFKFIYEAEDIHRLYFWIVNPFYSIPFFDYAMNCADKYKSKQALYREFLKMISPLAAGIENSNWGCSILSKRFKIVQYILSLTFRYPILKKLLKKNSRDVTSYQESSKIIQCMRDQLDDCNNVSNFLSREEIEKILNNPSKYRPTAIDNLFTITSFLEKTLCNKCTLKKYYND
jgi:asparagine synthase (glutamine-hydrolysing)